MKPAKANLTSLKAIFSIVQYYGSPGLSSEVLTMVVIFLPLSSLWASANVSSRVQQSVGADIRRQMLGNDQTDSSSGASSSGALLREKLGSPLSPPRSFITTPGKTTDYKGPRHGSIDDDLEAQGLDLK